MPVEPMPANFRKFEADNPHIHLNVYGTLGDETRSPVTPLYVSNNKDKDANVVNILFTRNEEGKGTLQLHQEHVTPHAQCHKESQEEAGVSSLC